MNSQYCSACVDPFLKKVYDRPLNDRYMLTRKIGAGGCGVVYLARDIVSDEDVAIKLEHHSIDPSLLESEAERYQAFHNVAGFPQVYWYGQHDDYRAMAFELLGPSLDDLFEYCEGQLSLKTTLLIADQLLTRFKDLHTRDVVHRDVKPRNFLLGAGSKGNLVYLIDFGLAVPYVLQSRSMDEHSESRDRLRDIAMFGEPQDRLLGTAMFASIRGHQNRAQTPSDDLESLGYMLIYFLKGRLPWQVVQVDWYGNKNRAVMEKKKTITTDELCAGLPDEFRRYMDTVKQLDGSTLPDYEEMRSSFKNVAAREGYEYDDVYDWTVRDYIDQAGSR